MENIQEAKRTIEQFQNIRICLSESKQENIACGLALFYTLRDLGKNVNIAIENLPEQLKFLTPSLDYISYPKNLVLSIPRKDNEISQIRYEKDESNLKINLTVSKGNIKKNDISFYFIEPKPDLLITLGIKDKIEIPIVDPQPVILNIDNQQENSNFGRINIISPEKLLPEIVFEIIKAFGKTIGKNIAANLLAGVIIASDNFGKKDLSPAILEIAAALMRYGADRQTIIENIHKN